MWPLSREAYPKQLLSLTGSNTLLQETVKRLDDLSDKDSDVEVKVTDPILVCNETHRYLVLDQLESIGCESSTVVLEPFGRNTAPALTIAALSALKLFDDPILLAMPADHVIGRLDQFHEAVLACVELASEKTIVSFGIVPRYPETGFGYIKRGTSPISEKGPGIFSLDQFIEKPDAATASSYLRSGDYLWNSGIFAVRAQLWLEALNEFRPDMLSATRAAWDAGAADGSFYRVDPLAFESCPSDSIDYAVMEKISERSDCPLQSAVVPLDAEWSDIGSWQALLANGANDDKGNVHSGDTYAHDTNNSLLISDSRFVATIGVSDTIVVETVDAVLVAAKDRSQDVKEVVRWLEAEGRDEGTTHRRVHRPWGSFEQLDSGERYQVKRLTVKPGEVLSLQMHHHRAEHWVVVRGTAKVTRGSEEFLLTENQSTYIPLGVKHRLGNPGQVLLEVIEVQSGTYFGEDDIVRFDDVYNRLS